VTLCSAYGCVESICASDGAVTPTAALGLFGSIPVSVLVV